MKKLLLGSTALVAAGLMAGEAYAADGVKLGIGGRYMGAAGINAIQDFEDFDNAIDHPRSYVFKQDVEVYFLGETTLDNGLTVGARVELEGQTSGDTIDAVFAYFSGGFGELRFGDTAEAYAQFCYLVPSAAGVFGADSPNFNFSNNALALGYAATNGTCYGLDDKSTKVVYFSPSFGGFSFAASFTPDNTEDTRNTLAGAATRLDNDLGQNSENVSVAANFAHDFNAVNIILGGGATWSFDKEANPNNTDEAEAYNAYARVGFAGFTLGGAMEMRNNFGLSGLDSWVYGAGATYNWDAWTVGIGWTHGEYEYYSAPSVDQEHDIFSLTASYALGPGIQLDGVVEYDVSDFSGNAVAGTIDNYEGLGIGLGTLISF